ncbi:hypothetical protein FHG87_008707 [Trinorchestia longiramus]|nr:hypothetical protein FHG87_008707 [Trinorchestia longiramus]
MTVAARDTEAFDTESVVVDDIVSLGTSMGWDVDSDDVEKLVEDHRNELITEELRELHSEWLKNFLQRRKLELQVPNSIQKHRRRELLIKLAKLLAGVSVEEPQLSSSVAWHSSSPITMKKYYHVCPSNKHKKSMKIGDEEIEGNKYPGIGTTLKRQSIVFVRYATAWAREAARLRNSDGSPRRSVTEG